jgi:hypothetical protein
MSAPDDLSPSREDGASRRTTMSPDPDVERTREGVRRRTKRVVAVIVGVLLVMPLVVTLFGVAVQQLWNHLLPEIFGLPTIGFWQALGLLVLSWLLLGGRRGFAARRREGLQREGLRKRCEPAG